MKLFCFKRKKKVEIKTPQNIRVADDQTGLSGIEYCVSEHKCENCGATFTLWYEQKRCPWCYSNCSKYLIQKRWICQ